MFWNEPLFRRQALRRSAPGSRLQDVFEQFWPALKWPSAWADRGDGAERERTQAALNIWRHPDRVRIAVLLPGVADNAIDLAVDQNLLTIRVQSPAEAKATSADTDTDRRGTDKTETGEAPAPAKSAPNEPIPLRSERAMEAFERQVRLPFPVEADKVTARTRQGILWIDLPRAEADKPRKIAVQAPAP